LLYYFVYFNKYSGPEFENDAMFLLSLSSYPNTFLPEDGNRSSCRKVFILCVFEKLTLWTKRISYYTRQQILLLHLLLILLLWITTAYHFQIKRPLGSNLSQFNPVSTLTPNVCTNFNTNVNTNFDFVFVHVNGRTQVDCFGEYGTGVGVSYRRQEK
jgi:hypothetical protein